MPDYVNEPEGIEELMPWSDKMKKLCAINEKATIEDKDGNPWHLVPDPPAVRRPESKSESLDLDTSFPDRLHISYRSLCVWDVVFLVRLINPVILVIDVDDPFDRPFINLTLDLGYFDLEIIVHLDRLTLKNKVRIHTH